MNLESHIQGEDISHATETKEQSPTEALTSDSEHPLSQLRSLTLFRDGGLPSLSF
jgi:hypothetical protein